MPLPRTGANPETAAGASDAPAPFPAALFLWLSPGFPVGAYAYSHGLEWAVAAGRIAGADDLKCWLVDLYEAGSARNDLAFLSLAWRAAAAGDDARLDDIATLSAAMQPSAERRLETLTQGAAFASAVAASWPCPQLSSLAVRHAGALAYPIALGVAAAGHAQPLAATLTGYGLAFAANLMSAALRLSLIGQTDGQKILAALAPTVARAADFARDATESDIASAAFVSDIASMAHETLPARLFRT